MRTEARLLRQVWPYRWQCALALLAMFIASALDGFTIIVLIPLLKTLFGRSEPSGSTSPANR